MQYLARGNACGCEGADWQVWCGRAGSCDLGCERGVVHPRCSELPQVHAVRERAGEGFRASNMGHGLVGYGVAFGLGGWVDVCEV